MFTMKNQRYNVYHDPYTRRQFEGKVTVTAQFAEANPRGFILCEVKFDNDPDTHHHRAVHPDDQIFD